MSEDRHYSDTQFVKRPSRTPWLLLFVVLLAGAGAAYLGRELLESERSRAAAAQKSSDDAAARLRTAEENAQKLEEKVAALEQENARLGERAASLSGELEQTEEELSRLKDTYDSLEEKMKAEIRRGDIALSRANGKIQVDLVDKVLFDSGEAELTERGREVLSRVGAVLARVEDKQIQVSGHTDDSPISERLAARYPTNWELSVARAVNVVRFLTERGGVPAGRLVAAGHGQFRPVASNATPAGRARNRRIEILLMPALTAPGKAASPTASKPAPAKPAATKKVSAAVLNARPIQRAPVKTLKATVRK